MSLEEQIAGLEKVSTNSAEEWRAKCETVATLKKLIAVREHALNKQPDPEKMANLIIVALGLPATATGS